MSEPPNEDESAEGTDRVSRLERLARQQSDELAELKSKLVAQEHRVLPAISNLYNAFVRGGKPSDGRIARWLRRRHVAALQGMASSFRSRATRFLIIGGGGLLTVMVAVGANRLLQHQNHQIQVQNQLVEAERRSALMFELTAVLDKVSEAADRAQGETGGLRFAGLGEAPLDSGDERLSGRIMITETLHGRIAGLASALRPYRFLSDDPAEPQSVWWEEPWVCESDVIWCHWALTAWEGLWQFVWPRAPPDLLLAKPFSPERGQLLLALVRVGVGVIWSDITLGRAYLRDANLSTNFLREANLSGAELSGANLAYANLFRADLREANLRGANLYGANLHGAILHGADLRDAELSEATLKWADLRGANLAFADLFRVTFAEADLTGANLSEARNLTPEMFALACADPKDPPTLPEGIGPPRGCDRE